ncbi:MAG: 2-dehydro-3-deoxyglucarate aldolase [Acidobacteria bacterium]|nr:2-dehydro-3-deoxyglucarate aldolase [Acidobacteriota bacterium]
MKWIDKETMRNGIFAGTWLNAGSAVSAEIAGSAGFDWALIDLEHGSGDRHDLYHQLLALAPSPTAAIVRVPHVNAALFKDILDLGPAGVMVPNVESAEAAREIVQLAHIPPAGTRGAATSTRASGYGATYKDYLQQCNQNIVLMAQIESRAGLSAAEAIAATEGIDILFVGPTDLSIEMQVPADMNNKAFRQALVHVAQAARNQGKLCGALVRSVSEIEIYSSLGYNVLTFGSDRGILYKGFTSALASLRPDSGNE